MSLQGVKGVIADATSFESARRRNQKQHRAFTGIAAPPDTDVGTPLNQSQSDPDSGEDEENFIRTWRKNRLAELRLGVATQRKRSPSKRKYGRVESVDATGYLDAVERVSAETVVVVTIYNDQACPQLCCIVGRTDTNRVRRCSRRNHDSLRIV